MTATPARRRRVVANRFAPHFPHGGGGRICYSPPVRREHAIILVLLLGGCTTSLGGRLTLPNTNTLVRDKLVIHSDFPLAAHHRLFEELTAERADLDRRLGLPQSDEPIHVYLFETAERFQGYMKLHYPRFPDRRAFFVENDFKLAVYVQWGDQTATTCGTKRRTPICTRWSRTCRSGSTRALPSTTRCREAARA